MLRPDILSAAAIPSDRGLAGSSQEYLTPARVLS